MQATQRRTAPGVIGRLVAEPHRFAFHQAVRLLLRWLQARGINSEAALRDVLRFRNSVSLAFPASDLESLALDGGMPADWDAALARGERPRIRLTPAFMGLLGIAGALPLHYTERVLAATAREKDDAARAFLDAYSTRMLAMSYQAWARYRVEARTDGADALLPIMLALSGAGSGGTAAAPSIPASAAAMYAGLLRQRPVSASAVARVLGDYFGVPVLLEQFVGGWEETPPHALSRLGQANVTLGESGALGQRRWRHDRIVRLRIGPLDRHAYDRFLPGGEAYRAMAALLGLCGLVGLRYECQLVLCAQDVAAISLGGSPAQLGWNTFLVSAPARADRDDARFAIEPA